MGVGTAQAREGCWSLMASEMAESQQGQYWGQAGSRKMGHSSQKQGGSPAWVGPRPQVVTGTKDQVWTAGSIRWWLISSPWGMQIQRETEAESIRRTRQRRGDWKRSCEWLWTLSTGRMWPPRSWWLPVAGGLRTSKGPGLQLRPDGEAS